MTTEDDFHAALDLDPTDQITRGALADWLQDRGDPRAPGYWVMARLRLYPSNSGVGGGNYPWEWWHFEYSKEADTDCIAPVEWFDAIKAHRDYRSGTGSVCSKDFTDRRSAEDAAAAAWATFQGMNRDH